MDQSVHLDSVDREKGTLYIHTCVHTKYFFLTLKRVDNYCHKINIVLQVFKLVSGHVTLASLQLILGVLEPKSSKEELMENEEEEEVGEGGSGDGSEGDGSEMDEDDRGSLISEDEGSDNEAGQGEEGEEDVDPAFRAEVQKALGAAAVDSDAEVFYIITAAIILWSIYNEKIILSCSVQTECCIPC